MDPDPIGSVYFWLLWICMLDSDHNQQQEVLDKKRYRIQKGSAQKVGIGRLGQALAKIGSKIAEPIPFVPR